MWANLTPALLASLVWILLIGIAFWQASLVAERLMPRLAGRGVYRGWLMILGLALLVRLVPALLLPVGANYDIESFRLAGEALLGGQEVYGSAAIGRHPYLPFQMYLVALALFIARHTFLPFVVLVKLPAVLADVAITGLILDSARRSQWAQRDIWILGLAYALNPISILVSAYHGQFDAIPVMLLLLAWSLWFFGRRLPASAISLGFAVLSKTWPIIFLPVVWLRMANIRQRLAYGLIAGLIPLIFTAGYIIISGADPLVALRRPLTHTGVPGYWGPLAILAVAGKSVGALQSAYLALVDIRRWLLLAAGLLVLWRTRRQPALDALVTLILAGLAVSAGMGSSGCCGSCPLPSWPETCAGCDGILLLGRCFYWFSYMATTWLLGPTSSSARKGWTCCYG